MSALIGIDIGTHFTKVVYIEQKRKPLLINTLLFDTVYDKTVSALPKTVDIKELVNQIISNIPQDILKESRIGINIPSGSPTVFVANLPKMPKKELEIAALIEARRKMIPQPGPNSVFEIILLGEKTKGKVPQYEVLIVKEEKTFIDIELSLFKKIGRFPYVITPLCASVSSLLAKTAEYRNKKIVFVDIGYGSMNISISRGFDILFNRSISFGCKDIIQGLADGLGVSFQQAEGVILKNGIPDVEFDAKDRVAIAEEIMRQKYEMGVDGKAAGDVNLLELRMLMEPFLERTVQEIRRTFIYFKERYGACEIEKIFFLGGGALINNLVSIVGARISPFPETAEVDKLLGISFAEKERKGQSPLFAGAAGLALSTTLTKENIINFLPFELKKKEEIAVKRFVFSAVCILISCGFLLGWINFWIMSINAKMSLSRVNFEIGKLRGAYIEEKSLTAKMELINKRNNVIKSLIENRKDFLPILSSLAIGKTDEMVFSYLYIGKLKNKGNSLSMNGESDTVSEKALSSGETGGGYTMELKVNVLSDYEKACGIMENFVANLRKSRYFKNINLIIPSLNTIIPTIDKNTVSLTKVKWQKFTVKADLEI